jgi:FlaA1/EpsC-like NDP-sugar epimerase
VPVFERQIEQGGPVTVTDASATRYFMTIPEACELVILTTAIAQRGGLYLLDMGKPVRILDLAHKMIRRRGLRPGRDISIVFTGLRPGEYLHETLVGAHETLLPTSESKIFSIECADSAPEFTTLTQSIHTLEESLLALSDAELREQLFAIAQKKEVIITTSMTSG